MKGKVVLLFVDYVCDVMLSLLTSILTSLFVVVIFQITIVCNIYILV